MTGNDSWFRRSFRSAEAQSNGDATTMLSHLRATRPVTEYQSLFSAFRAAAAKTFRASCSVGPRSASDLVWARKALKPLPLEKELLWAAQWLSPHSTRVNEFRCCAIAIQAKVMCSDFDEAMKLLSDHVRSAGWSLWAVELQTALLQLSHGTPVQREWLGELQARSVNSIPGLLFQIFGDRNDDTYSYDAFYGKCKSSFPRFETVAPWLVDYLKFRALALVEEPEKALPNVLCRDISSSLVDYYEDVIEALTYIESDKGLAKYRAIANTLVSSLIRRGFQDHRLGKLALAFDLESLPLTEIYSHPEMPYQAMYLGVFQYQDAMLPAGVAADLVLCQNEGAATYEAVGRLLKWGINFRGLGIGAAVAMTAVRAVSTIPNERLQQSSTFQLSATLCMDDAAALSTEKALQVLAVYLNRKGLIVNEQQLLKPSEWSVSETLPNGGPFYLWLATRLLEEGDFGELGKLTNFLRGKTLYWERQCAKLDILSCIARGQLVEALESLEEWCRKSYLYALEFPGEMLFTGKKWSDFRNIDPVLVGLVAHYENTTRGNANVAYICKMACRAFLINGQRERLSNSLAIASGNRRAQLISFLSDVWIEENLALCDQFESTANVRDERMSVLQLLLNWDNERALEYAEAIRSLTFEQTLQRGLERIDQTRVFVNDSAITRWAEKELEQDYERWRRLSESSSGGHAVDDLLRQYALDPTNVEVLNEFANGKPTAADTVLINLIDRLYKRFLLDPIDGLDTYLSVRIRHGSLRGTVLGPLEEQGLLYSNSGFSEEAFDSRWNEVLRLHPGDKVRLIAMIQDFSRDIRKIVDELVEERVQVQSVEKPNGAFKQVIPPHAAKVIAVLLAERPPSFHVFLYNGYFVFWKLIEQGLDELRAYVNEGFAAALHTRVEILIQDLRALGQEYLPLVTTLTTASTMTKSQCDTVAEWFQLPSMVGGDRYQLPDAIEIARVATKNVHRAFPAKVEILMLPATSLPLTTSALAVLMECLFVIFENAWNHSGLASDLPPIQLHADFDSVESLLTLTCRTSMSAKRKKVLLDGELNNLRTKYLGELPIELISVEGGSGFPKLARLTRAVSRDACPRPFDFGIEGDRWYTRLTVPLYEREGAFEAYE